MRQESLVLLTLLTVLPLAGQATTTKSLKKPLPQQTDDNPFIADLLSKATAGNSQAQSDLGDAYAHGEGVREDKSEAFKWFKKAAYQGNAWAQFQLGAAYRFGYGIAQDASEAYAWYSLSVINGREESTIAQKAVADEISPIAMEKAQSRLREISSETVTRSRKAAERGDASAQLQLARCYYRGIGVSKDWATAVRWYRKAAMQDNTEAQVSLASCYFGGLGVKRDDVESINWFRKAAMLGDNDAQQMLGNFYSLGQSVPQDNIEAYVWFSLAAVNANLEKRAELKRAGEKLSPQGLEQAQARARTLHEEIQRRLRKH